MITKTRFVTGSAAANISAVKQAWDQCWPGMSTATSEAPAKLFINEGDNSYILGYLTTGSSSYFNFYWKLYAHGHPVSGYFMAQKWYYSSSNGNYYFPVTVIGELITSSFGYVFTIGTGYIARDPENDVTLGYAYGYTTQSSDRESSYGGLYDSVNDVWLSWNNSNIPYIKSADGTYHVLLGSLSLNRSDTFIPIRCCVNYSNNNPVSLPNTVSADGNAAVGYFWRTWYYLYDYTVGTV